MAHEASWFDARLDLVEIKATDAGETARLELALTSRADAEARATWVLEVRDDRGTLVQPKSRREGFTLAAGTAQAFELELGALPEGFYRVAVVAVARSGEQRGTELPELYFESRGGTLAPLSFTEFAKRSAYNEAQE